MEKSWFDRYLNWVFNRPVFEKVEKVVDWTNNKPFYIQAAIWIPLVIMPWIVGAVGVFFFGFVLIKQPLVVILAVIFGYYKIYKQFKKETEEDVT